MNAAKGGDGHPVAPVLGLGAGASVRGVALVSQTVATAIVTRELGAAGYGTLALAVATVGLLVLLGGLQLSQQIARDRPTRGQELWGNSWLLGSAMGAGLAVVTLLAPVTPSLRGPLLLLVPFAVLSPPVGVLMGTAMASHRASVATTLVNFVGLGKAIAVVLLVVLVRDPTPAAFAGLESLLLLLATVYGSVRLGVHRWRLRVSRRALSVAAAAGLGLLPVAVSAAVLARLDVMMVAVFDDAEAVGIYQVAVRLSEVPFELYAGALVLFVSGVGALGDGADLAQMYRRTSARLTAALMPLIAGIAVFGDVATRFVFGAAVTGPVALYPAVAVGIAAQVVTGPNGAVLVARDRRRALAALAVGLVVVDGALNLLLIPPLGAIGAAVATSVAFIAVNMASSVLIRRHLGTSIFGLEWVRRSLVVTALPVLVLLLIRAMISIEVVALGLAACATMLLAAAGWRGLLGAPALSTQES